jgi:dienelactone hydrolase
MPIQRRYLVLFMGLALLFSGTLLTWELNTNLGTNQIVNVQFSTAEGVRIFGRLYVPVIATPSNPVPGVLVIHGLSSSKEGMMAFNVELARHGFVVLAIDVEGHGFSDPGIDISADRGAQAGLEYLSSLLYVESIGIVGHSMGAWMAIDVLNSTALPVGATVLVGGGVDAPYGILGANSTYPLNLLVAIGRFDEIFYGTDLPTILAPSFGILPPVIVGHTYGNISEGTGRRLILPPTNHLFEVMDPIIVAESVQWLTACLDHEPPPMILSGLLIYPLYFVAEAFATLGLLLTVFPLLLLLLKLDPLASLSEAPTSSYAASKSRYWKYGILYGAIGLGFFLPFLLLGVILQFAFLFPQIFAPAIGVWLLGIAIVAMILLRYILRRSKESPPTWTDLGGFVESPKAFIRLIALSGLTAFLAILWIYLWALPFNIFFHINFQILFPIFKPLTPLRALFVPVYLLFAIPFFLIEGVWLIGFLRVTPKSTWTHTQTTWTLHATFIKTLPYITLVGLQFLIAYTIGILLFPGFIGFMLLFMIGLIPLFLLTPTILAWSYRISNRIYIGALICALILAWSLAATFAFL